MSEEIIVKNNPSSPTGTYPNSQGAFDSGGIGGVTSPAARYLGNDTSGAGANLGSLTGANAVNPSFSPNLSYPGAGILRPEQASRFIDYIWDATTLAKDGRRVTMRANTMELEKVNVGQRVIRAANQGDATFQNAGATFSKVELNTKKLRLDWEVSGEALEDNIEGAALEDHLVRLMTNSFGNDIEDLAINGTGYSSDGAFLGIMQGFTQYVQKSTFAHQVTVANKSATTVNDYGQSVTNGGANWTTKELQAMITAIPRRYRALQTGLKFYAGTDVFANIVRNNATALFAIGSTEDSRGSYFGGAAQTFGGARQTRVLGVDVMEVPYYPADYVDLTFPANRIWGFQRDITVNRLYVAKKDTVEYTVFVRFGINWEEQDAISYAIKGA
jgi:HK97 family phage major capsid protein